MRRKLLVTIALGAALAIIAAGTATSRSRSGRRLQVDRARDATAATCPQCVEPLDDDGDGLVDLADPDCSSPVDTSEYNAADPAAAHGHGAVPRARAAAPRPRRRHRRRSGRRRRRLRRRQDRQDGQTGTTGKAGKVGPKGLFGKQKKKGKGAKEIANGERQKITQPALRNPDGSPTRTNPSLTVAAVRPRPDRGPQLPVIDSFEIPPFLLPIYQSCGTEYGIPWQVLASINKIETAFGTNLNVSSAGAEGWMQFIPSTWQAYGVDANEDGRNDPYNPVDAICAAARYLRAAGGDKDLRTAIFAYNHADWYVDEVLLYANQYGKLPDALVGSLTGLTEGAHFPVAADARYADDINDATALAAPPPRAGPRQRGRRDRVQRPAAGINIYSQPGAPVVAVNDGDDQGDGRESEARQVHRPPGRLRQPLHLRPARLGREGPPGGAAARLSAATSSSPPRRRTPPPTARASAGDNSTRPAPPRPRRQAGQGRRGPANTEELRQRLFALPQRSGNAERAGISGQLDQLLGRAGAGL